MLRLKKVSIVSFPPLELTIPGLEPHVTNSPDAIDDEASNEEGKLCLNTPRQTPTFDIDVLTLKQKISSLTGLRGLRQHAPS